MLSSLAAWFACGVILAGFAVQAQPVSPPAQVPDNLTKVSVLLSAGDVLSVKVLDLEEIGERAVKIDESGRINLPVAGLLRAAGQTPEKLQAAIADRLLVYLKQPLVTVTVTEFHEQMISVTGAVNSPGFRKLSANKGLLEAISEAGGLKADAGPVVRLTRLVASGASSTTEIKISEGENIPLRSHDIINVPQAGVVYILGEVGHPGVYDIGSPNLSVLSALARAGGSNRNADFSHVRVLRVVAGKPERVEIIMDLNRMLAGKTHEFFLDPQDIFYIPTNKGKVVTTRALEAIVGTGSSIAVFRGSR